MSYQNNTELVGKIFLIEDPNGKEILYEIVLPEHEDKIKNRMSCSGPYGRAFTNKMVGDSAVIGLGGCHKEVSILDIS